MESIEQMAKQLKAVSDPNRLKILAYLKNGEVCACDFVEVLNYLATCCQSTIETAKRSWNYCRKTCRNLEALSFKR